MSERVANEHSRQKWEDQVTFLEDEGFVECTDSELSFIDRISAKLDQGTALSFKDAERLKTLFHRVKGKLS